MAEMTQLSKLAVDYLLGDRSVFANDQELSDVVRQLGGQLRPTTAPQGLAGTYRVDVRPVKTAGDYGILILRGGPEVEGVLCYCAREAANYARTLIADGDAPAATLDHHGDVASVQTAEGSRRREFPKAA